MNRSYNLWFHSVSACLLAEQAYGPDIYSDSLLRLSRSTRGSLRALVGFLGEPYAPQCLIPLQKRINSSNVPTDFRLGEPDTDPLVIERATRLNAEIETNHKRLKCQRLPSIKWKPRLTPKPITEQSFVKSMQSNTLECKDSQTKLSKRTLPFVGFERPVGIINSPTSFWPGCSFLVATHSPRGNAQRSNQTNFCGGFAAFGHQHSHLVSWTASESGPSAGVKLDGGLRCQCRHRPPNWRCARDLLGLERDGHSSR